MAKQSRWRSPSELAVRFFFTRCHPTLAAKSTRAVWSLPGKQVQAQRRSKGLIAHALVAPSSGVLIPQPTSCEIHPIRRLLRGVQSSCSVTILKGEAVSSRQHLIRLFERRVFVVFSWSLLLVCGCAASSEHTEVHEIPEQLRSELSLDPFYKQTIDANGLAIVASSKVSPYALLEAQYVVLEMCAHRPEILPTLGEAGVRLAIMGVDEYTTDLPEHSDLEPAAYWDVRARGLGATKHRPAVSCGEENVLNYRGDPYRTESILVHEFAHAIHEMSLDQLDQTFDARLRAAFADARERGLWDDTYAATNHCEYWAEATQSWFDTNRADDSLHNHVDTREELKTYDPEVAALCAEVFGDRIWRYTPPRDRRDSEHLRGFDSEGAPIFSWPEEMRRAYAETEPPTR